MYKQSSQFLLIIILLIYFYKNFFDLHIFDFKYICQFEIYLFISRNIFRFLNFLSILFEKKYLFFDIWDIAIYMLI